MNASGDKSRETTLDRRVVVIGAGQAGLSAAHYLARAGLEAGVDFEVIDANPTPGGAWSHRWDALVYGRVNGLHDLPGSELGDADPDEPAREVVKRYYGRYEREQGLRVRRPWRVRSVADSDDPRWRFEVTAERNAGENSAGEMLRVRAGAVISGTGTWDAPFVPWYPGRFDGRQLTTRQFGEPEDFLGQRVLVVGGGVSAVQFMLMFDAAGVDAVWSTRTPPRWREQPFDTKWGQMVEDGVAARTRVGLRPLSVVAATGLPRTPEYMAGVERGVLVSRGGIARLTPDGVDVVDGSHESVDVILWATGFRAALAHLSPLGIRERGGGVLMADDDVTVPKAPGLFLVGYGRSASTLGATRAGRRAARAALDYSRSGETLSAAAR